jgi:ribosome-binding protein aMBF1 (putative translation factor)
MTKRVVSMLQYVAYVSQDGNTYRIRFPDAPGCETRAEEAVALYATAKTAIEQWLRTQLVANTMPGLPHMHRSPEANEKRMHVDVASGLSLAVQIRHLRLMHGWSQAKLASLVGVSQQQIAKLEDPDADRTAATVAKVVEVARAHNHTLVVAFEDSARKSGSGR